MKRKVEDLLAQSETCMELREGSLPYMCTLSRGHEGDHVAEVVDDGLEFMVEKARWPRRETAN